MRAKPTPRASQTRALHEDVAFTGATRRRLSRFEIADGGTLFLDEIATASLAVQEKILRVIEYGSFERVGSNETHHVDVRIVAATNVDLPALAESGRFRHDLIDRLASSAASIKRRCRWCCTVGWVSVSAVRAVRWGAHEVIA
jgi:DNA-binding NtrC family response regulator